jgi:hypothetical protein
MTILSSCAYRGRASPTKCGKNIVVACWANDIGAVAHYGCLLSSSAANSTSRCRAICSSNSSNKH